MVFNHDGALLGAASLPSSGTAAGAGAGAGEGGGMVEAGDADSDALPTKEAAKEAQVRCFWMVLISNFPPQMNRFP